MSGEWFTKKIKGKGNKNVIYIPIDEENFSEGDTVKVILIKKAGDNGVQTRTERRAG